MLACSNCGGEILPGSLFCQACGAAAPVAAPQPAPVMAAQPLPGGQPSGFYNPQAPADGQQTRPVTIVPCENGHYFHLADGVCPHCHAGPAKNNIEQIPLEPPRESPPPALLVYCPRGHAFDPRSNQFCPQCGVQTVPEPPRRKGWMVPLLVSGAVLAAIAGAGIYFWPQLEQLKNQWTKPVQVATPAPSIDSFVAEPEKIESGQPATLRWFVQNATSLAIDQGVGEVSQGQTSVHPTTTTTYTLTATGPGGVRTRAVLVTVSAAGPPPPAPAPAPVPLPQPVIDSFIAEPSAIDAGQPATLHWAVRNAAGVSIDPEVGAVNRDRVAVHPASTTRYTLTATGAGGTVTQSVVVIVNAPPPPPPKQVIDDFSADPDTIERGQSTTLLWSVRNATGVSIDQGIGAVNQQRISVHPSATTTYTLTASGPAGPLTRSVTVQVVEPPLRSGILHCSGAPVQKGGRVVFDNLPKEPLRFVWDHTSWQLLIQRQPDGSKQLVLVSLKPGVQTFCEVRWEIVK